jgi:hypothetical protein
MQKRLLLMVSIAAAFAGVGLIMAPRLARGAVAWRRSRSGQRP